MNSRRNTRDDSAYRRPAAQPAPAWARENYENAAPYQAGYGQAPYGGYDQASWENAPYDQGPYEDAPYGDEGQAPYGEAPYEEPPYEEASYDQEVYEEESRRGPFREEEAQQVIATNSTVKLTCTLASMMSLFALFLCFAEKKSNAIRHFSRQSVGLAAAHLILALVLALLGTLLGVIPFLGFLVNLVCWLCYIAVVIVAVFLRVRMMLFAWRGLKFTLPVIGRRLERIR